MDAGIALRGTMPGEIRMLFETYYVYLRGGEFTI